MSLAFRRIFSTNLAHALPGASSPDRVTTVYYGQNFQNNFQHLSVCLVVLSTVFKNLSHRRERKSRFFWGFDVSFRLFQKRIST